MKNSKTVCSSFLPALWLAVSVSLIACSSGGDGSAPPPPAAAAPVAPTVALAYGIKQLQFSWPAVSGATHYRLLERPDATAAFGQVGADIVRTMVSRDIALHRRINAAYRIEACNSVGCTSSGTINLAAHLLPAIGYFKASNAGSDDLVGRAVALSADGATMAVSALGDDSSAAGIDGDQFDNSASDAGAVYLFTRSAGVWAQQAYLKASNTGASDEFGFALALSADGSTLAVGAPGEDSSAIGIDGNQLDNTANNAGAVYVFARNAGAWSQQAYIKASNAQAGDQFGESVAVSADGDTLAVGASTDDSNATGINGNEADNSAINAGAVYVFTRSAGAWTPQTYIKASNTGAGDQFGIAVALSADGRTLAVGAREEDSNTTGVNGNQLDNSAGAAGAVYVFTRNGGPWTQQAYIKASNTEASDLFGLFLTLSADGETLAVGALGEDSGSTGINGNQFDNSAPGSGAVYVFTRSGGAWTQQAYVKASNPETIDFFGAALALSADGSSLAVGALEEDSNATGINGNQADNSADTSGAAYVFTRSAGVWTQQAYIKAPNAEASDLFGSAIAISGDGATLAIAAFGESSNATGIGGNQADNSVLGSGAVYLY